MRRMLLPLLLINLVTQSLAFTIEVPSALHPNIQSGIDAASEGDTVLVLPGVHSGEGNKNLDYHGTNLAVMSSDGSSATTLSLTAGNSAIYISNGESLESVFAGFRIEGSNIRSIKAYGASLSLRDIHISLPEDGNAISLSYGTFVLEDVVIDGHGNWDTDGIYLGHCIANLAEIEISNCWGNALYSNTSELTIEALEIRNVRAHSSSPVDLTYGSATIDDALIVDCYGDIGGALNASYGTVEVFNSTFIGNDANRFGGAVALNADETHGTFTNCTFIRNSADNAGSGLICYEYAHGSLINCVFFQNYGDAIHVSWAQSFLNLDNTLVAFNEGYGINADLNTIEVDCSNFFANGLGNYNTFPDQTGINGNISKDPMFCNEGGEDDPLTVSLNSPCLPENNDCGLLIGNNSIDCGLVMYTIAGHIENEEGIPLAGVELSGHYQNYFSDEFGDYSVPSIEGWTGSISPYFENYHFTPENREYLDLQDNVQSEDYLAFFSTLHLVPAEYASIGEALDIALEGDTILVAPGIYSGSSNRNMEFRGENVVLLSDHGPDVTTIDCENLGRAFVIHFGESSSTIIDGFTIQGGIANENLIGGARGGAILIHGASPTLRNLTIQENTCPEGYGGGIAIEDSESLLENLRLIANEVTGFDGNGGGIHIRDASPTINNCLFYRNFAFRYGGGLAGKESPFQIARCTFVENVAGWGGGAVAGDQSTGAILDAVVIASNRSTWGGAAFHGGINHPFTFTCSVFFDNTDEPFHHYDDPIGVAGNFTADPVFCDPEYGDFTLSSSSPCLPENNSCTVLIGAFDQGCP